MTSKKIWVSKIFMERQYSYFRAVKYKVMNQYNTKAEVRQFLNWKYGPVNSKNKFLTEYC